MCQSILTSHLRITHRGQSAIISASVYSDICKHKERRGGTAGKAESQSAGAELFLSILSGTINNYFLSSVFCQIRLGVIICGVFSYRSGDPDFNHDLCTAVLIRG